MHFCFQSKYSVMFPRIRILLSTAEHDNQTQSFTSLQQFKERTNTHYIKTNIMISDIAKSIPELRSPDMKVITLNCKFHIFANIPTFIP